LTGGADSAQRRPFVKKGGQKRWSNVTMILKQKLLRTTNLAFD
jgi:hypothetical protein